VQCISGPLLGFLLALRAHSHPLVQSAFACPQIRQPPTDRVLLDSALLKRLLRPRSGDTGQRRAKGADKRTGCVGLRTKSMAFSVSEPLDNRFCACSYAVALCISTPGGRRGVCCSRYSGKGRIRRSRSCALVIEHCSSCELDCELPSRPRSLLRPSQPRLEVVASSELR
jgi:hypothetical protein